MRLIRTFVLCMVALLSIDGSVVLSAQTRAGQRHESREQTDNKSSDKRRSSKTDNKKRENRKERQAVVKNDKAKSREQRNDAAKERRERQREKVEQNRKQRKESAKERREADKQRKQKEKVRHDGQRPGVKGSQSSVRKPGNNRHDNPRTQPKPQPKPSWHQPRYYSAPRKPYVPVRRPVPRPPHYHGPTVNVGTILGVALGTLWDATFNYFATQSIPVYGYADDQIYLNNVSQFGITWPEATMYYSGGRLTSSQFTYSSAWNNTAWYDTTRNSLVRRFGQPYIVTSTPGHLPVLTWYGRDGSYITLEHVLVATTSGDMRYFTTLTVGN